MNIIQFSASDLGTKNTGIRDITSFGGVGDGQRQTITASITSGASPVLTPSSGIFTAGDIGKVVFLNATGFQYPTGLTSPTITAYNAGTGAVTLSGTNNSAQSNVSMDILWGTDNTTAAFAFRTWALSRGGAVTLTFPDGRYCLNANPFSMPNKGLSNVKWAGLSGDPDACIISHLVPSELRLGGDIPTMQKGLTSGGNSARLETSAAGASTVTLADPVGFGSKITVGRYCLIGGFDMQGVGAGVTGYPTNLFFHEWNKITAYDSETGIITLETPTTQEYKSTWPLWSGDTAFQADLGGPSTIWVAPADYDSIVELNDLTLDNPYNQNAILCRDVILRRIKHNGPGTYPTQCITFLADECDYEESLEIDKITGAVTFLDSNFTIILFQSASPNSFTMTGGTIRQLSGTPRNATISGVTWVDAGGGNDGKLQIGTTSYGRTDELEITDCVGIKSIISAGPSTDDVHGGTAAFFSMSGGVITFPKADNDGLGQANPLRCFAPGTWLTFDNKLFFQVLDVTEDGTDIFIQTNLAGGFPITPSLMKVHPCPQFTMRTCTGTAIELEDLNVATEGDPLYSYSKRTLVAGATSGTALSSAHRPFLMGRLVSEKIEVTVPYVGAGTLDFKDCQFTNRNYVKLSDNTTASDYGNTVNMKIGGVREIRAATTATGAQSLDTLKDMTAIGEVNFFGSGQSSPIFSANVTNGETPTLTVEYVMDQGIS